VENDVAAINASLQLGRIEIAKMGTDAGEFQAQALRANSDAEREKFNQQARALLDKQQTAALDFISVQAAANAEMQSLTTQAGKEFKEAGRKSADEIFTGAENMRDAIDQAVAALGPKSTVAAKGVADMVNGLISDGILTAEEMGRIREGISRMRGLTETNNPAVLAAVNKMVTLLESDASVIKPLQQRMLQLEQTFEQLRASSTSFPPP
jgi:hypothetical protein